MKPDIERLRIEVEGLVDAHRLAATLRDRLAAPVRGNGRPHQPPPGAENQAAEAIARAVRTTTAGGGPRGGSSLS
jgi:hypothetical protein